MCYLRCHVQWLASRALDITYHGKKLAVNQFCRKYYLHKFMEETVFSSLYTKNHMDVGEVEDELLAS